MSKKINNQNFKRIRIIETLKTNFEDIIKNKTLYNYNPSHKESNSNASHLNPDQKQEDNFVKLLDPNIYPNYGYYHILCLSFWSVDALITKQFLKKCKYWMNKVSLKETTVELQQNDYKKIIRAIMAYKILHNNQLKNEYLYNYKIRCFLSQPLSNEMALLQKGIVFPYFIFAVLLKEKESQNKLTKKKMKFLEFDFINEILLKKQKSDLQGCINFSDMQRVMPGFKSDELLLELQNLKPLNILCYFSKQRDLLMDVIHLAIATASRKGQSRESQTGIFHPESAKNEFRQNSFNKIFGSKDFVFEEEEDLKLELVENDQIIPPKIIRQELISKKCNTPGFENDRWISLGQTQIIISIDKELKRIVNVIPLKLSNLVISKPAHFDGNRYPLENFFREFNLRFKSPQNIQLWMEDIHEIMNGETPEVKKMEKAFTKIFFQKSSNQKKQQRLQEVNKQISHLRKQLSTLEKERNYIENELGIERPPELNPIEFEKLMREDQSRCYAPSVRSQSYSVAPRKTSSHSQNELSSLNFEDEIVETRSHVLNKKSMLMRKKVTATFQ